MVMRKEKKKKKICMKEFSCSKEAYKNNKLCDEATYYNRSDSITGYGMMLEFMVSKEAAWTVTKLAKYHNHAHHQIKGTYFVP